MKIGIIGTGNMGKILLEAFVDSGAAKSEDIAVMNRTRGKALELKGPYPSLTVTHTAAEAVQISDLLFICVKPHDVYSVLTEISPFLKSSQCVVSITSPISVKQLEKLAPCSVARVIPSITNRASAGVSLITFGENCWIQWKKELLRLMGEISVPVQIEEEITRVSSDIVSCGPAFVTYLLRRFIQAAVNETDIPEEKATQFTTQMIIGLGELLKKDFYTLPTLQEKVCVKGGITGEGIKVLEEGTGDIFNKLFHATHEKFKEDLMKEYSQYK